MFARTRAVAPAAGSPASTARDRANRPPNPVWRALTLSVSPGEVATRESGDAAASGGSREVAGGAPRSAAAWRHGADPLSRIRVLGGGEHTVRRAVPINVPHPGNRPTTILDEEELQAVPVRRALKVGRSDDPSEVEADQVAEHILRMELPAGASPDGAPQSPLALSGGSGGRSLAPQTRAYFEPRFGVDLGGVRLHTGAEEASTAAQLNARAFAYGSGIWLGAGEHEGDRRLMAHELAHVLQAGNARAAPDLIRRYVRTNTLFLWDLYSSKGSDPANVTDDELRTTIEYEDYRRADLVWRFSETVALGALRRSMDLFAAGVRGRRPNYIRSAREARAAAHGLESIEVTELGFTGDHLLTRVPAPGAAAGATIDDPDGSAPVWTRAGVALPVAYTQGAVPAMFARFEVTPALAPPVPNVELRARVGTTVVGTASGLTLTGTALEGGGAAGQVGGIGGGAAIPGGSVAGQLTETIRFEISTDGGRVWFQAGSAPVRFFFTEATPVPPGGVLREDALDIATRAAATPPVEEAVAREVGSLVTYNPSVSMPVGFTTSDAVMEALVVPHQCDSQAFLMRYLLMSLGMSADVDYFWRGSPALILVYNFRGWFGPSYQYDRPPEDFAVAQPHFLFHALTRAGGVRYDPTYGQPSVGAILESVPGATDQFHPRATFLAARVVGIPWSCPH